MHILTGDTLSPAGPNLDAFHQTWAKLADPVPKFGKHLPNVVGIGPAWPIGLESAEFAAELGSIAKDK